MNPYLILFNHNAKPNDSQRQLFPAQITYQADRLSLPKVSSTWRWRARES